MKIKAEIRLYNYEMRKRRAELGLSQAELGRLANCTTNTVSLVERLGMLPGMSKTISAKLNRIADALEMDFDKLFPQEYMDALAANILPRNPGLIHWVREIRFKELAADDPLLLSDEMEDSVLRDCTIDELKATLSGLLAEFRPREREVIERRFGLAGYESQTLEEVACKMGYVTRERVRQIEVNALRKLRHPIRSNILREYL